MKIYRNLIAMAAAAVAMTFAAQARADTIFFLTTPEGGPIGSIPISSAVEVDVALISSTSATVTFTAPGATTNKVTGPFEINVNGAFQASSTEGLAPVSPCTGNVVGHTCATGGEGASYFGQMNVETGSTAVHSFVIDLTALTGNTSWTTSAAVLTPDSKGFEALVANGTATQDGGFATPLPAALPLFATGIGGLGLLGWRRKRKAQAIA